ncbi:MAG: DUF1700 domain-containing protein [Agathobacter sp.]|nr:DUF1700 domain-containing protein [Clostridiales bacterium]MDY2589345.1 DUF1700 domain-containing protein [Agathobacter sp.]
MNREEYMKLLKKQLRKLPKEDFNTAVAYYEEYFDEAGAENEKQAIEDLGSPEEAAGQIIRDIAINNTKKPAGGMKKGMNAVWVGLLAVFAAPVALPIILALLLILLALVFVAFVVVFCVFTAGASIIVAGPVSILGGFAVITENVAAGLCCFGYGLIGIGAGLLVVYAMYQLCRVMVNKLIQVFGRMAEKGGKKHD